MKPFLAQHRTQTLSGYETTGNPIVVRTQKEKPILFCGSMVRAILEGRKTQTRRVAKGLGSKLGDEFSTEISSGEIVDTSSLCPHGQVGDRLWVRETFSTDFKNYYPNDPIWYLADGDRDISTRSEGGRDFPAVYSPESKVWVPFKWKPSIFMPRWASRITLEITAVRVERLQFITSADVLAEGVRIPTVDGKLLVRLTGKFRPSDYISGNPKTASSDQWLIAEYASLWDSINGKKHPWKSNPWVWVITFKKI